MLRRESVVFSAVILLCGSAAGLLAQDAPDEAAQQAIAERFTQVLEKNPRRGTAFDKVYGHHVERGTLDELLKNYQQKADSGNSAVAWMIVGLIEAQRGRDLEAIEAFSKAETLDPASASASYHLGQSLILADRTDQAAQALERAITRQPPATDLLEIYQTLGRVYQRAQQTDKALGVWNRMEKQFPNDPRVQEQIATTLVEEGDLAAALPRYESLAKSTRDKTRQAMFQVEAAEIKVRLGKPEEGLKDFEKLLNQLNPGNWLFRDVRRRIETVFLKANNQAGLIEYYETWIQKNPEDLDAISQLATVLAEVRRNAEARSWLKRSLKQAPSNRELRLTLINLLASDQKFDEAAAQYEELEKHDPNNPDLLRDWGRIVLKDYSKDLSDRKKVAAAIWQKLLTARPNDAHAASQVADLFRQAHMSDEAIKHFRRAIELAPDDIQYREYLGEYLLKLERSDEALATWTEIATGSRRTAVNLARMAELLSRNEKLPEAVEASAEACQLDPKDLNLQLKHADLLSRAERHEEALKQLAVAQKLVANDEERDAWLQRELAELKSLDRLTTRITEVHRELTSGTKSDKSQELLQWYWLAMANDAAGKSRSALDAITRATELSPGSASILVAAARMNESQRNLRRAVEIYTKLAAIDRRFRTDYLQRIARLEEQLGNRDRAIQVGRELVAAAPANPEVCTFFAELCFRMGKSDEGIQVMRRSLRANPGDIPTLMRLAAALINYNQTNEGIELLWRAFDRSSNLDDQLPVIQQLTEAHVKIKQINTLYIRLERERRNPERHREMTLCLAHAHETAGDFSTAQRKLESLLTSDSRDVDLLGHLRNLAERQKDLAAAVRYQRQLWQIAGNRGERFKLAQLMLLAGQGDEAIELLTNDDETSELSADVLKLLDNLSSYGRYAEVGARLAKLRQKFPENWELLYREAVTLARTSPSEAQARFTALLKLNASEDDPSLVGSAIPMRMGITTATPLPFVNRIAQVPLIQQSMQVRVARPATATTSAQTRLMTPQQRPFAWWPPDYGHARVAAWCWILLQTDANKDGGKQYLATHFPEVERPTNRQQSLDNIAIQTIQNRPKLALDAVRQLIRLADDDVEAKVLYMQTLARATNRTVRVQTLPNGQVQQIAEPPTAQLTPEQLDEALEIYRAIGRRSDLAPLNVTLMDGLTRELVLSGRGDTVAKLVAEQGRLANSRVEVQYLLIKQYPDPELTITCDLMDRLIDFQGQPAQMGTPAIGNLFTAESIPQVILQHVSESKNRKSLLSIWSRYVRLAAMEAARTPPGPLFPTPAVARRVTSYVVSSAGVRTPVTYANPPNVNVDSGNPGFVFRYDALNLLGMIRRPFELAGEKLIPLLEQEIAAPDRSAMERLYWQHSLAHVLWLDGKKDQALGLLKEGVNDFPERRDLAMGLVMLFETAGRHDEALDLIEIIAADNPNELRELQKMTLRLAMAGKQIEQARTAASKLADGDLTQIDLDLLIAQLIQLSLPEKAETLLVRIADLKPLQLDQRRKLMEVQLTLGKKEEAARTAADLLSRIEGQTVPVQQKSTVVNGQVVAVTERIDRAAYQQACYKVLHETGQLAATIDEAEKQLRGSPNSEPLILRLISLHAATSNHTRVDELIVQKLKLEADKPANRYALALKYIETDQSDLAMEQMKILLERDAEYFASRCRETLFRYDSKKELLPEFGRLLAQLDWCGTQKGVNALPSVIDQLRARDATTDMADQLFIKIWETRPERRIELLQRFSANHWWNLKEVQDSFKNILTPPQGDKADQWSLFGQVIRYDDGDSGLVTVWNRMLSDSESRMSLDSLAKQIGQGLKQQPEWRAGHVMQAMVDLRQGRVEAAQGVLEDQFSTLLPKLRSNSYMAWEIGQELTRHKASVDTGIKYLTVAVGPITGQVRQSNAIEWMSASSPASALIKAYSRHGRQSDARKMLVANVPAQVQAKAEASEVTSTADLSQVLIIGRALRSLNYQMDAIEIYLDALQRSERMQIGGYDPRTELQASLVVAFGELKPELVVEYLEGFDSSNRALSPRLFVRQSDPGRGRLQTRWEMMLIGVVANEELRERTNAALEKVIQAKPNSLTPMLLTAHLSLAADKDAAKAVDRLVQFVQQHPLSKEGESTTVADADQVALWLVARDCLTRPDLKEMGEKLAERALAASRRVGATAFGAAITAEWKK